MLFVTIERRDPESRYDYSDVLKVFHKGKVIIEESDGGEPEDQTFGRDWDWVSTAIEKAYKLGLEDAVKRDHRYVEGS